MATEPVRFPGHSGAELSALLDHPEGPHLATALFAHCFTCGKDIAAARRIAARLASMGFAVLRFDFTGLGESGGAFAETGFLSNVGDLQAAARWLEGRGMAPGLLIGHSLGGAAALKAAGDIASVKAVATIAAPFDPAHVLHHLDAALERIDREGAAEVPLGGRPVRIGRDFVREVTETDPAAYIRTLGRALLVLHAPGDGIVGIENAADIFMAAKHPKSFVTLDHADHLVSKAADADYAAEVIAAWAPRYLGLAAPRPEPGAPEGVVRVSEVAPDGFLQNVTSGPRHHLYADEPAAVGGTDRGLSPYGLLAAALGACTSMTLRMYANRKKWPLTHVRADVSHDRVHAGDCADCGDGARIDRFRREITLEGDLDDEQRARLLEIADNCPVHRTLEAGARVETTLAQPAAPGE